MKESDIYQTLKKAWPYYIDRIEDKLKGGIPDVLVVDRYGEAIFIELKLIEFKKNETIKIKIRPSQYIWFKEYTGVAFMLMWDGDSYYLVDQFMVPHIYNGMPVDHFKSRIMKKSYSINPIINIIKN